MRRPLVEFPLTPDDMDRLFAPSNTLTIDSWDDRWLENIQRNLYMHPTPTPVSRLVQEPNFHTILVCGAGWTLRKLKPYASMIPPSWGIICADRALQFLLDVGLKPSLVITMDGDQEDQPIMQAAFDRLATEHPDVPVMVDLVCCPTIVRKLKRPYFFRSMTDERAKAMIFLRKYLDDNDDVKLDQVGHGGNVGSVCTIVAKYFYYARHVVLTGFNFSMEEGTKNIDTWERREVDMEKHQMLDVSDIYGRPIRTMANLHNYRTWQEYYCFSNDDVEWVLCNDGGYLGVHDLAQNYKHYTYETLPQAIARLGDHGLEDH